jgi:hypothetical protein
MSKYVININYIATYRAEVEGDFQSEGDAYNAARYQAENADINEFIIGQELESQMVSVD